MEDKALSDVPDIQREVKAKECRLRGLLATKGAEAVLISRRDNFSWFTCGASNHVSQASDLGVCHLLVTQDRKWALCENIEAARVGDEELGGQGFEMVAYPWYEGTLPAALSKLVSGPLISDTGIVGSTNVLDDIARLRWTLTPEEIARYQVLGGIVSRALAQAARAVQPGMSEHEIAALLSSPLIAQGVQPVVCLIAVDGRIERYRHPIPTDARLERVAMLVVCGRKWGLIASATRLVHFGPLPADLRRKHDAVVHVDQAFVAGTMPGRRVGDIVSEALAAYRETGFAEEWKLHHQGGPTGYVGRDYRGNTTTDHPVLANQAFAWNPSITGTKSEDTIIATAEGPLAVTEPLDYPALKLAIPGKTLLRADILVR